MRKKDRAAAGSAHAAYPGLRTSRRTLHPADNSARRMNQIGRQRLQARNCPCAHQYRRALGVQRGPAALLRVTFLYLNRPTATISLRFLEKLSSGLRKVA